MSVGCLFSITPCLDASTSAAATSSVKSRAMRTTL